MSKDLQERLLDKEINNMNIEKILEYETQSLKDIVKTLENRINELSTTMIQNGKNDFNPFRRGSEAYIRQSTNNFPEKHPDLNNQLASDNGYPEKSNKKADENNLYNYIECGFCQKIIEIAQVKASNIDPKSIVYCCSECERKLTNIKKTATPNSDMNVCVECGQKVGKTFLNIYGFRYHTQHFVCYDCRLPLYTLGGYYCDPNNKRKFYCQRDYLQRFALTCNKCNLQITLGDMVTLLGKEYHSSCFTCTTCRLPFDNDVCFDYKNEPFCERHWHSKNGTICNVCDGIIKGKCVLIDGIKYHPDCVYNS
ncbi:hypothetical protein BB559_000936 [Furculomyces boomerangus]|uniref:LIM zinc-binding domain-containing protein n=1 Tax=Furculomyces boomerangus TaxID=61424 RepID=A0A2T9Z3I8_9FUNG|nr:hypothetical protein BB559_000936 [Furculomyces boomerangus]